jgi:hypothetical protein
MGSRILAERDQVLGRIIRETAKGFIRKAGSATYRDEDLAKNRFKIAV